MTSSVAPIPDVPDEMNSGIPNPTSEDFETQNKGKRVPRRILHFSDGTLEEYSSEEESDGIEPNIKKKTYKEVNAANPATLTWVPWVYYHSSFVGYKALAACDYFGEYLARFFGIISPKYGYEIEHYKRVMEEEKQKQKQDVELGSWAQPASTDVVQSEQLKPTERLISTQQQWTHDVNESFQV